jgi:hypothetical protein
MRPSFLIGALAVAIAAILIMQYWPAAEPEPVTEVLPMQPPVKASEPAEQTGPGEGSDAASLMPDPVEVSEPAVVPEVELPELTDSDAFVLAETSAWSLPEIWLQREDLLSRAAVVLQNAADGRVPRRQLAFLTPAEPFPVVQEGERYFVDPASYARYDTHVATLLAIPPQDLAGFIDMVSPLLTQALALLGDRRVPAELVLDAIGRLESLPNIGSRVELLRPNVMYKYAAPNLEKMPELDKQLLRFGPKNISKLRAYASEFKDYYLES